jgi:hypothetical protein
MPMPFRNHQLVEWLVESSLTALKTGAIVSVGKILPMEWWPKKAMHFSQWKAS